MANPTAQGYWEPTSSSSEANAFEFQVEQKLGHVRTCTVVKVISCTNTGGLAPVGSVDVQPLVNMVDGVASAATPHATVHSLPYVRIQGGVTGAVICDPRPGDIGIAIICDRDISNVKANKAQANPGSRRRFDFADGVYLGGILNGTPTQYLQFVEGGGITMADSFGNFMFLAANGVELVDKFGNVLLCNGSGIIAFAPNMASLQLSSDGAAVVDHFGNSITTDQFGFVVIDYNGSFVGSTATNLDVAYAGGGAAKIRLNASGITLTGTVNFNGTINANAGITTTGLVSTGAVIAGSGGADQVGLQTHSHPANGSPPTPGT